MTKPFGYELLIDLYNCNRELIDNITNVYNFLDEAVQVLGVHKQAPPYVFHSPSDFPDKAGISAWVALIESGIQCHTLTVNNFVSVDYYTCTEMTDDLKNKLITLAKAYFSTEDIEYQILERGKKYNK